MISRKRATLSIPRRSQEAVTRYVVLLGLAACTASASEVEPPQDQFFYPTAAAVSPDDSMLFVTNANSILQYSSGTLDVVDLSVVDQVAANWTIAQTEPANCSQDPDHTETLICDETQFLIPTAGARVGNFATDLGIQDRGGGNLRMIIPVRGDPSVTWVDWDGSKLSCNATDTNFDLCDDNHRLSFVHNDQSLPPLPEEPYNVYVDSPGQFAVVTHLTTGDVTLINTPPDSAAVIADVASDLFLPDMTTGIVGATGVAGRLPGTSGDVVYVGSPSEDRIQTFTVGRPINGQDAYLIPGNFFFLDQFVGIDSGLSSDTRGMKFSADGNRLYLVNRDPASLQIWDTSIGPTGYPNNTGTGSSDICREASTLAVVDGGDGDRVYVTCFQDGQLYVVDPRGLSTVEDIIDVGRGPYAVTAAPSRKKVYVTNFLDDTIAVIDVAPGSPTYNRVVLRVGTVKPPDADGT